jgi:hypothetical protein
MSRGRNTTARKSHSRSATDIGVKAAVALI